MTFTVDFGWWIVPAVITILTFGCALFMSREDGRDQYGVAAIISLGFYLMASVVSLLAWLILSLFG